MIGISRYDAIRGLDWADSDAVAIDRWLRLSGVADSDRRLLTDKNADLRAIIDSIRWLQQTSMVAQAGGKTRNLAIIYFAGHGDVEDASVPELAAAYLLASDVAANGEGQPYSLDVGGALAVDHLKQFVSAMAAAHVNVLLITDACRDGHLIGDAAQTQITLSQLVDLGKFATLMASTNANGVSHEGKQWGGGHGVFTWYLLDGLEHPNKVQLGYQGKLTAKALLRYADDSVEAATHGQQIPQPGLNMELLLPVPGPAAPPRKSSSGGGPKWVAAPLAPVRHAGLPDPIDSAVAAAIDSLRQAIRDQRLLTPKGASAWDFYQRLSRLPAAKPYLSNARSELEGTLESSARHTIREYLTGGNSLPRGTRFEAAAREMQRALQLLDADDPLRPSLEAKEHFLDAYAILRESQQQRYPVAESELLEALRLDPRATYALNAYGVTLSDRHLDDSATVIYRLAITRAPNWILPRSNLANTLNQRGAYAEGISVLLAALRVDSTSARVYDGLGSIYFNLARYREAEAAYRRAMALAPQNVDAWVDLASLYRTKGRYDAAGAILDSASRIARENASEPFNERLPIERALLASDQKDYQGALEQLRPALELAPYSATPVGYLGDFLRLSGMADSAEHAYRRAIELDTLNVWPYNGLAYLMEARHQYGKAEDELRLATHRHADSPVPPDYLGNFYLRRSLDSTVSADDRTRYLTLADSCFHISIARDSQYLNAYYEIAGLFDRRGNIPAEDSVYHRALDVADSSADAPFRLGHFYLVRANADTIHRDSLIDRAEESLRRAVSIDSTLGAPLDNLGWAALDREQFDTAAAWFRRAAEFGSNTLPVYSRVLTASAAHLLLAGRFDPATTAAHAALSLDAGNSLAQRVLSMLAYLTGHADEALASIDRQLAAVHGTDDDLQSLRALVLIDLGRAAEARTIMGDLTALGQRPSEFYQLILALTELAQQHDDLALAAYRTALQISDRVPPDLWKQRGASIRDPQYRATELSQHGQQLLDALAAKDARGN
ncbi:MAG: tetratricopeptide repeat protein [Gemmatimonadales bacterium]